MCDTSAHIREPNRRDGPLVECNWVQSGNVPRPRVPDSVKRMKRQIRQARYRKKPEIKERRHRANQVYYRANAESIKAKAFGKGLNGLDLRRQDELARRFRVFGPGDPFPPDADEVTRRSYGRQVNTSAMWIVETRWPAPDGPWGCVTAAPDLSTLLGLGGKGENLALKEFLRGEMLRRFPGRYRHVDDLPTEEQILRRNVGPPDKRATEKRVAQARAAQRTPDFLCPVETCRYHGPMTPTGQGPYRAGSFLEDVSRRKLGAEPDELLPGAYCPQCRSLVLFRSDIDIGRPPMSGDADEVRCDCGFLGRPLFDMATDEYNCPACGLVVGVTLSDSPRRRRDPE
jgi:hypothetical protein